MRKTPRAKLAPLTCGECEALILDDAYRVVIRRDDRPRVVVCCVECAEGDA